MVDKKKTVAIVGLGLIGGSLALALKDKYHVVGCSRRSETEEYALSHGMIEEVRPIEKLRGVDCVIVCTALWTLTDTVKAVYEAVGDSAVITDVGSVKGQLEGLAGRIVGGHPMAGNEKSGIQAAEKGLFENAYYCIVPYENSLQRDVEFVTEIARTVGANPITMTAGEHDALAADYSHMPHMCAYALSDVAIGDKVSIAGSGFTDSTRIACSDPQFWTEVFRLNRYNTLHSLDKFMENVSHLRNLLYCENYDELARCLQKAQQKRKSLGEK